MILIPSKYQKFLIFVKLLILRYQFIGITLSKPHLECTFYDKQINVKKYKWKFGSVETLLVGDCICFTDHYTIIWIQDRIIKFVIYSMRA